MRTFAIWLALALMPLAAMEKQEKLHNDRVAAEEITLAPGEIAPEPGHPAVVVWFSDGSASGRKVAKGDVVFRSVGSEALRNTGTAALRLVRVEFLGDGAPETWGTAGLSPNYKLLLENRYTRTYDIRIPAGTREPQHTHHARVVVCLSGAVLKHLMPDGREEPSTLATGEVAWRGPSTHIGQNLGKTDLWVIAVEPK